MNFNANIDDSQQIFGIVQQCAECFSRVQDIAYKYVDRDAAADINPIAFPPLNTTQKVLENWIYLLSYAPLGQERLAEMGGAAWGGEFLMINNAADLNDDQKQVIRNSYQTFLGNLLQVPAAGAGGKRRRQRKTRKARK